MADSIAIQDFALWDRMLKKHVPVDFNLELTARCNFNCRHCYVNRPAGDEAAQAGELTCAEALGIADQAVELGAIWCVLTGGEPLLRQDFADVYLGLKRRGLLVSVCTNAALIRPEHVELFQRYPPRDIEVTVYGVTPAVCERVTRRPGACAQVSAGLGLLKSGGIKVRLKAMALRSNVQELDAIAAFCRAETKDYYRFDPFLHLRVDRDPTRNAEIIAERLTTAEVVALEQADPERKVALERQCHRMVRPDLEQLNYDRCCACTDREGCERFGEFTRLLHCAAGIGSFDVAWDGTFRLCSSLILSGTTADLRRVPLRTAWNELVPKVRALRTVNEQLLRACKSCSCVDLCLNCPAHAYLETGDPEAVVSRFCEVARERQKALLDRGRPARPGGNAE